MNLLFENKINQNKSAFIAKIKDISKKLDINPDWLMAAINLETAGTFRADIQNPVTGATGLIQFMPKTAQGLGTTTDQLKRMNNVQQLDYVYKYLSKYQSKLLTFIDVYLAIFFPAAMAKGDDFIIQTKSLSASIIARQNPLFDLNKDGKITISEIKQAYIKKIPEPWATNFLQNKKDSIKKFTKRNVLPIALITISVFIASYYTVKWIKINY